MQPYAFISYLREDSAIVDRLCADLGRAGIRVWRDRSELQPGMRWERAIRSGIENGAYFIACFSSALFRRDRSYMSEE